SERPRCAAALAWRVERAARAADAEPPVSRPAGRGEAAQLQRLRPGLEPCRRRCGAGPVAGRLKPRRRGRSNKRVRWRPGAMRIAGQSIASDRVIEVRNPWNDSLVGTVPKATVAEVRQAFEQAAAFKATLTRHQRATILHRTAAILEQRKAEISDLITA